jgi:RimJ/RimL family protein N-acetyltransferase
VIETERLILRMPRLEDAAAFVALFTDPVATEFTGGVHPDAASDPEWPLRRWLERWEADGIGPFVAELREDGAVLGRVGLRVWNRRTWVTSTHEEAGEHAQPELGWALIRAHWGHGYATEAARAAREWARSECGIGLLISLIAPGNVRSQRVAQKLDCMPGETVKLFDKDPAVIWEHPA